ncbi:MAG: hypothetical protein ACREJ3_08700, partial [Polyangiaceae bacterium]
LPRALRLAPVRVPWSRVFSHEVTLGAPALFAEGMTGITNGDVRDAVLAHAMAVIDAFGTDRIEDEQIEASPAVYAVLGQARRERNRALMRVLRGTPLASCNFESTDLQSVRAIRRERQVLRTACPVEFEEYERASRDKQGVGIVASIALARAAGWDDRRCDAVRSALEDVWLGLQMNDDVVDWEDDMQNGGAWAVCLAMAMDERPAEGERLLTLPEVRRRVLASGVLRRMLAGALRHMRAARRLSAALGAQRLSAWALGQEQRLETLITAECRSPGYAVRAHALSAWAGEVLA